MNINYLLKKEGITNIKELDTKQVKILAKDIAIKLCLAFPEHCLSRKDLYHSFCTLHMYTATMPHDSSGAKYISGSNSIYFNNSLEFFKFSEVAMHECIHFIQESRCNDKNHLFGLQSVSSGLALNEASVQLMASEANMLNITEEKYYDITINTISPNYYPLECTLVNQIAYFTGTYPLYTSTLNSNLIFKKTFVAKFSEKIYNRFSKQLDKLLILENELNYSINKLQRTNKKYEVKQLNQTIAVQKQSIAKLFFNIQNYIIRNCFACEYNSIRNLDDLSDFKNKLYNFKDLIGITHNYSFYNLFYCDMMNALECKKEEILKYGEISLFKQECMALTIVDKSQYGFKFMHTFVIKLKKLFKLNKGTINDYYN